MVGVVIPVYKEELNNYEWLSVKQCFNVLGSYPIMLLTNKEVNINPVYEFLIRSFPEVNLSISYFDNWM